MVLSIYVDESDGPPIGGASAFVFGGFIAPAERWAAFSNEWQEALDMHPRMKAFHMQEVWAREWKDGAFRDQLRLLYKIIERHVSAQFHCIVDDRIVKRAFASFNVIAPDNLTPYKLAYGNLIHSLVKALPDLKLEGPVEFIFDRGHEKEIKQAWKDTERHFAHLPTKVSEAPVFRDDEKVLPLQAADLSAWWCRRHYLELMQGLPKTETPWIASRKIPFIFTAMSEEDVRKLIVDQVSLQVQIRGSLVPAWDE